MSDSGRSKLVLVSYEARQGNVPLFNFSSSSSEMTLSFSCLSCLEAVGPGDTFDSELVSLCSVGLVVMTIFGVFFENINQTGYTITRKQKDIKLITY